jgi:predicted SprT family Zn-dependent metalloprotease
MDAHLMATIDFKKNFPAEKDLKKSLPRYQLMQREYEMRPYLRPLSDTDLGMYFQKLMLYLTPGALKGARDDEKASFMPLMERFTHFLEEVKHRGVDLKSYAPLMREIHEVRPGPKTTAEKLSELNSICDTSIQLKPGTFYTDSRGKVYRCVGCNGTSATLILMDIHLGKSLNARVVSNADKWRYFFPLRDDSKLKAYTERFHRLQQKDPKFCSPSE